MVKDFQSRRRYPRKQRFMELPALFGEIGPGIRPAISGDASLQVGHKLRRSVDEGYIQSHQMQNPLQGVAVRAPVGSASKVSYGFRKGWSGTVEPAVETTGIYQPSDGKVAVAASGVQEVLVDSVGIEVAKNVVWKSGTSFKGTMDHANSADRVYTFQNADGTVAFTSDIPASYTDEQAQDAVGGMVDGSLTYVDGTPLLQRAALTGDVTASAGSNSTTIANDAVTYAKMQDVSAASKLIGRGSASGSGNPEEITLGSGLSMSGTTLSASSTTDFQYAEPGADFAINDTSDVQIVGAGFSVVAGDQVSITGSMDIYNNTGASRTYYLTIDFNGAFDTELQLNTLSHDTGSGESNPVHFEAVLDIRASNLAYMTTEARLFSVTATAPGTDNTTATTNPGAIGWGRTTNDLTGSLSVTMHMRSSANNATQTCRLHKFQIRKVTP